MFFTDEEKESLLLDYQPLIRSAVSKACNMYGLNYEQVKSDLYQTAALAFLRHLDKIEDRERIPYCAFHVNNYVRRAVRNMFFIKIPREKFNQKWFEFHQYPIEYALNVPDEAISEDEWISDIDVEDFLDTLSPEMREAFQRKIKKGESNREIMPVIEAKNEMGVTRAFRKAGRAYVQKNPDGKDGS